ncbi:MAG: ATP-binding protein [Candidatus Thiosymbion ectosymbiont of Robbea hypermnestra]|nr:ATP-binding protein [Candidatus Thiosymbion ectosymbiont of Robbea hypermnestra]
MRIERFSCTSKATGWNLKPVVFGRLTLLVGASGVGKTRILRSILDVKRIARGSALNGAKWNVEFTTTNNNRYCWRGEFEDKGFLPGNIYIVDSEEKEKPKIEQEVVTINGSLVVERTRDEIYLNGKKTVRLSQNESIISLLKEEEQIKEAYKEFDKVVFDDNTADRLSLEKFTVDSEIDKKLERYETIEEIRDADEDIKSKLYFAYRNQKPAFHKIAESFIDVFPYVEEVKIEPLTSTEKRAVRFLTQMPLIQLKEKGVKNWIDETQLSSGMYRTLVHIAQLHLCSDSTLILIDEFENSLGINCIDELTNSIASAKRNLQFIITSHHPYIINNIGHVHWQVIARKAETVISRNAEDFNFDKSKHKAFTQLINLEIYSEGVES